MNWSRKWILLLKKFSDNDILKYWTYNEGKSAKSAIVGGFIRTLKVL